ncbi:two-component regulator propeller domain-containing protein [Thermonema sp.]|uniref:two-component regulator propeller domain-containing protein n=1 Tax=Thermonema sp. TaxID=2231181 RepID=UPI0025871D6D|nr:two-component regulator propeller domain-containing protein [Thermonema sp.]
MKKVVFFAASFLLCCISSLIYAQRGNLFIQNYDFGAHAYDIESFDNDILCFSTPEGIVTYDGQQQHVHKIPVTLYSLSYDSQRRCIWAGGKGQVGYLQFDSKGKVVFSSVFTTEGNVRKIMLQGDTLWAQTPNITYAYSITRCRLLYRYHAPRNSSFNGFFLHRGEAYASAPGKGIYHLDGKQMHLSGRPGNNLKTTGITQYIPFDKQRGLCSSPDNRLWLFDGLHFMPYRSPATRYVETFLLNEMLPLNDGQRFVFSTLSGGCIVVDKSSGIVTDIINYETGLKDDETTAIYEDKQGGLWISHAQGCSRVALQSPLRVFSTYPGLEGSISSLIRLGPELYVGTTAGLFVLDKIRGEQVVSRKVYANERKRLFARQQQTVVVEKERNPYEDALKAYIMQSVPYYFKKIKNIDAKCKQLLNYKGKLLVASSTGLYEVTRHTGYPIMRNLHVYAIYGAPKRNMLYVATEKGLIAIREYRGYWKVVDRIAAIPDDVTNLMLAGNKLYLGLFNGCLIVHLRTDGTFARHYRMELHTQAIQPLWVGKQGENVFFLSKEGALLHKEILGGMLLPYQALNRYYPLSFLYDSQQEAFFLLKNRQWLLLQNKSLKPLTNRLVNYFDELQVLAVDYEGNYWIVASNNIFFIPKETTSSPAIPSHPIIRFIETDEDTYLPFLSEDGREIKGVEVPPQSSHLVFHIAYPYYLAGEDTQFQYKIEGEGESEWSAWRSTPYIEFAYLPTGMHRLLVRARTPEGLISQTQSIKLYVRSPFYETWWFYILEILFLLSLLLLSIYLNRRKKDARATSILTIVSIITTVEFIIIMVEPYVDNFSGGVPVFKLVMNVILAYYLLPLERRVRKIIEKPEGVISVELRRTEPMEVTSDGTGFQAGDKKREIKETPPNNDNKH